MRLAAVQRWPVVPNAAPENSIERQIEIRIIHNDNDVLPAHFEMALLECWRAGLADDSPDFG